MCGKQKNDKDRTDLEKNQIEFLELKRIIIKAKSSQIREIIIRNKSEEVIHPEYGS